MTAGDTDIHNTSRQPQDDNCARLPLTTLRWKMSGGRFATSMLVRYGKPHFSVAFIAVAAAVAAAIALADLRWAIVALMIIFIVTPMIAAMLYFDYGLRPECFVNTTDHTLTFMPEGISATLYHQPATETDTSEQDNPDSGPSPQEEISTSRFFPLASITGYQAGSQSITIILRGKRQGFLVVPYETIGSTERLQTIIDLLISAINNQ